MKHRWLNKKIQTFDQIATSVQRWQAAEKTVVFTNGCFDLLHYGHIHYLADAKKLDSFSD